MNENPLQGVRSSTTSTDLVERQYREFDRISERRGVLGAMETGYQRGRSRTSSMLYEQQARREPADRRVNTFRSPYDEEAHGPSEWPARPRRRSARQLERVRSFHRTRGEVEALRAAEGHRPRRRATCSVVPRIAARVCLLQQVTEAFFEVAASTWRNIRT